MKLQIKELNNTYYFMDNNNKFQGIDYDDMKFYWKNSSIIGYRKNHNGPEFHI